MSEKQNGTRTKVPSAVPKEKNAVRNRQSNYSPLGDFPLAPFSLPQAAVTYAAAGWRIFPVHTPTPTGCSCGKTKCPDRGKHPRIAGGHKNASADLSQIREWWEKWPNANIGGVPASAGFLVVDVDGVEGERTALTLELITPRSNPNKERSNAQQNQHGCGPQPG